MKKRIVAFLALVLALCLLTACGSGQTTTPSNNEGNTGSGDSNITGSPDSTQKIKDTVTIAIWSNPQTLDPTDVTLQPDQHVMNAIFDTLVWPADENGNYAPRLAASYEYEDDLTLVFHLRDDIYFHNGEKLTADDVVFSLQNCYVSNGNKSSFAGFDPERTIARDETTVQVGFTYPNAAAFAYLSTPRGGIVCKSAYEEMGADAFKTNPVGSGMFKFVSFESGDRVVLARNEEYWGDKPQYSSLIFRIITEDSVRAMEIESGGIDIAMKVAASDFDNLKNNPNLTCIAKEGLTMSSFQFNAQQDEFADIRIRMAMNYALDMPSIVKAVYGDYATAAASTIADNVMYFTALGPYEQDQEYARQLLAEAGYADGFHTEITLPQESDMLAIAEICQNQWEQVGIYCEITQMEQVALREANTNGQNVFVRASFFCSTGDPSQAMMVWGSNWNGGLRVRDEKMDELLAKGLSTFDNDERAAVYAEIQQYAWDMYQMIPLACPMDLCVTTANLQGFEYPSGYMTYYNQFYIAE